MGGTAGRGGTADRSARSGRGSAHGRYGRTGAATAALVLAAGLALGGCGAAGNRASSSSAANRGAEAPQAAGVQGAQAGAPAGAGGASSGTATGTGSGSDAASKVTPSAPAGRSIIYTGEIQLRTRGTGGANGVDAAVAQAEQLVTSAGGFIDSEVSGSNALVSGMYDGQQPAAGSDDTGVAGSGSVSSSGASTPLPRPSDAGGESAQLVLRIPVASYNTVYQQLLGLGTVLAHERQAQDVTQQVVDISSRVKTQQASVARVRALMDRATSIADVTSLEQDLTQREADLESLESQLAALSSETAMSTVTVQLYSRAAPAPVAHPAKSGLSVFGALKGGWHALYETVRALLIALAATLPFLVPLAVLLWLVRLLMRRRTLPVRPASGPAPESDPEE
jgi:hypothetical protein